MKVLLLGDYSNVHATLARGLRELGHTVVVASDGDSWKDYARDIDLKRKSLGRWYSLTYYLYLRRTFRKFRDFDVVQLINPVFLPLKAERILPFYRFLRRHNKKVFLGAFGMDHYYVKTCLDCSTFRYSDFNMGKEIRHSHDNDVWIRDWLRGEKGALNRYMAADADGIVAGLYEYYASYKGEFARYCNQQIQRQPWHDGQPGFPLRPQMCLHIQEERRLGNGRPHPRPHRLRRRRRI